MQAVWLQIEIGSELSLKIVNGFVYENRGKLIEED
jgi:hypothetical protein